VCERERERQKQREKESLCNILHISINHVTILKVYCVEAFRNAAA
jgi:hypothetical protein